MSRLLRTEPEVVGGPEPLAPRIVAVEAVGETVAEAVFEDGEERRVDVAPLLTRGVFRQLTDPDAFAAVSVVEGGGGIEWACGPDLSAIRVYHGGEPVTDPPR